MLAIEIPDKQTVKYPDPYKDQHWRGIINRAHNKRTLIFCPIGLGNFLMLTPALAWLSSEIGRENLHILALKPGIKAMADASGYFGKVHFFDPDRQSKAAVINVALGLKRYDYGFTLSMFPTGDWRYSMMSLLVGAKQNLGFKYPNQKLPGYTQSVSAELDFDLHDTDQNCNFVDALLDLPDPQERRIHFPFAPNHPESDKLQDENYFVCHPGSSAERGMKEKRLPPEVFAVLIRKVDAEFGLKCQLIGGPEEADLRAEIAKLATNSVLNYTSKTLPELAGLIAPSKFYMGNDSGLMHTSVGLGKRCIAFFGPTDDRRTGPYSSDLRGGRSTTHLIMRREDLECTPCWTIKTIGKNPACIHGDTRCLKSFDADSAWPKIRQFISDLLS